MSFLLRRAVLVLAGAACFLPGCVTTKARLTVPPEPPIDPADVVIYGSLPHRYRVVGFIDAIIYRPLLWSEQGRLNAATNEMIKKAASMGANGLLIRNMNPGADSPFGHGYRAFHSAAAEDEFSHQNTMNALAIITP